jgi:hypothetical protein
MAAEGCRHGQACQHAERNAGDGHIALLNRRAAGCR